MRLAHATIAAASYGIKRFKKTIREEFSDSTLLCIAHRLRTIIDYDRVLVLGKCSPPAPLSSFECCSRWHAGLVDGADKGQIVEYDKPINLLRRKGTIFYEMCQKSGELDVLVQIAASRSQ